MASTSGHTNHRDSDAGSPLLLAVMAFLTGLLSGLVAALFRLALKHAEALRGWLVTWAHGRSILGFVLLAGALSGLTAIAAWLVRRFAPHAGEAESLTWRRSLTEN